MNTKALTSAGQARTAVGDMENYDRSGVMTDKTAVFDRESRTCHVCTTTTTKSCKKWAKWSGQSKNKECKLDTSEPFCEDIKM